MKQTVIVKGNISKGSKGITVILDPDIPFEELQVQVEKKFQELSDFLGKSRMAVALEGRKLTTDQQQKLLDAMTKSSELDILYLVEEDPEKEYRYEQTIAAAVQAQKLRQQSVQDTENMFYKGTLRSGQIVESESSVVIIGDVNPGGKVVSAGNIIILGALKGVACAGITGNRQAFVVALEMNPMQIRIDNIVAKGKDAPTGKHRLKRKKIEEETPKIAVLRNDDIFIENLDRGTLASLELS